MTAALTERDQLEDDDEDAPPLPWHDRTTQQQQLRRADGHRSARRHPRAGLLDIVSGALTAKVAHDVDAHPLALDALDAFTTTATALRVAITTEQQTIQEAEDNHQ